MAPKKVVRAMATDSGAVTTPVSIEQRLSNIESVLDDWGHGLGGWGQLVASGGAAADRLRTPRPEETAAARLPAHRQAHAQRHRARRRAHRAPHREHLVEAARTRTLAWVAWARLAWARLAWVAWAHGWHGHGRQPAAAVAVSRATAAAAAAADEPNAGDPSK